MKTRNACLFVGLLFSGASQAQGFMPWTDVMMMSDGNGDGMLTMEEVNSFQGKNHFIGFMPFMTDHFAECDKDKDKMVSMFELKVCSKGMGMTDEETSEVFYKGLGFMPRTGQ